jgi:lipopolysaccharide transport system ATP-binding protein
MAVRLGFAVATSLRPDILITDEVLAVGDESFQQKCVQWIQGYLSGGGTLLLCSHSMFHIQTLCRKALWLHHGKPRMYGDAFDVTREYLAHHERNAPRKAPGPSRARSPVPRVEHRERGIDARWRVRGGIGPGGARCDVVRPTRAARWR